MNFNHGDPLTVEVEADDTRLRNMAGNIQQAMAGNCVGIDIEGTLHLYPLHNVRSIEIQPSPTQVIKHVVRDARRVKG